MDYLDRLTLSVWRLLVILIFAGILISSFTSEHFAHAQTLEDTTDLDDPDPEEGVEDNDEGIAYQTLFESDLDADLLELLEENAKLLTLSDRKPASEAALDRRAREDIETFQRILRSEGYYNAEISYRFDRQVEPLGVVIGVASGMLYKLESYIITYSGESESDPSPPEITLDELEIEPGTQAKAELINNARQKLLRLLGERGYPLAQILDQKALVDHASRVMTVNLDVDPGPYALFGPLLVAGLQSIDPDYLLNVLDWPQGEAFDRRQVAAIRRRLADMRLFESIRPELAETLDENGELPVTFHLTEAKHRSIGFGVGYSSDEGFGGEVFWEHRNLRSEGERLRLSLLGTQLRQRALAAFEKPNFWIIDQSLLLSAEARHQDGDAFKEKTIEGFIGLRRDFTDVWSATAGFRPEFSKINDNETSETDYVGLGFPVKVGRDTSDDLLDPRRGSRLSFGITPNIGDNEGVVHFLTSDNRGALYYSPFESDFLTLAARSRIAATFGEDTDDIPAHRRLYAGGGGSIRGYEFQTVGPLDASDDPIGGRSAVEFGFETRFRIGETYGVVPFIEGGSAFDEAVPDFSETIRWAAGLGLRYYTIAGPLRFDLGIPLNPRDRDEDFEFYVSFGQAF